MSNSKPTVDAEIDEIGAIAGPDMSRLNEATDLESKIFILGWARRGREPPGFIPISPRILAY